ncbi:ACT domain-containing protein [Mesosutterella sp. OilRF-GAM-744-9]|uniref:ACT domain-containing protein n=1 Tax=Mesosutterella porci TaxID=2915351 RepID=A0ABS9MUN1_9BURK|nr:ACT domain-containing protein [Mesosutterella sp. oilRF-744-WT-GAM-9]MCG5031718.1 ACT domain-containing protein [Mesosutterella sp. oilRF-744-WT-GAM-9]MCI6531054.1 ACT domain-containing protein [Mesosutterella sp.]
MTEYTKENSALVAVIGLDQPGIVASVSSALTRLNCNIEEMTQSTLHDQFSGIYLVNKPDGLTNEQMKQEIEKGLERRRFRLSLVIRDYEQLPRESVPESDPFVVTIWGKDGNDIVSTFSRMMSEQRINIHDLRAKPLGNGESVQIFEVAVPKSVDVRALHRVMSDRATAMGLTLTMQHRRIFDAMHHVDIC